MNGISRIAEYSKNENRKSVIIFDSCEYTISALRLLCERHSDWYVRGVVRTFSQLTSLISGSYTDMVLCGMGRQAGALSRLLDIPDYRQGCCVLLTDKYSPLLISTYLAAGFDVVLSKQAPVEMLESILCNAVSIPEGQQKQRYQCQEKNVLSALLAGKALRRIAREQGISYAAVCRYKQSALKRAGLCSFREIALFQKHYSSGKIVNDIYNN